MKTTYKNKSMLKKVAVLGVLGLTLTVASCKKYTELNPLASLSETTAFANAAGLELVMNGVYQQAAIGTYNGSALGSGRGYPFGGASIEQAEMRGEDMVNMAAFYQITYEATYTPSSANNQNHWDNLYNLINQANVLIAGVERSIASGSITAAVGNSYMGEARFLRALAHHELLIHFSRPYADGNGSAVGVPYRVTAINTPTGVQEAIAQNRGTVAQDYTQLLADLDYAEANCPEEQTAGFSRATKGAAIALKTRIKLHQGDWAGVVTEGAKLGATGAAPYTSPIGGYTLEASPETPFSSYTANSESMFSIANSATSNGSVNGALPNMFGTTTNGGRALVATSPNLYNASFWPQGDLRKTLLQQQGPNGVYYSFKYRVPATSADWAPIIRYAEVLLNVAEASQRNGNPTLAFNLLNAVRNRSVPVASRFAAAPADLLRAILNERRVEFAAEGRRWPDIHRLALDPTYGTGGVPAKIRSTQATSAVWDGVTQYTPAITAKPYADFRFLFPLPLTEINSNPTLAAQQNPGY
jgi:hypothetical protein